jgi:septal ring factor EnvC (AmiA/AmiB activator)
VNPFIQLVQQYAPLFGVLAAVATVLGVAFTIYKTAHDRQVKALQRRIDEFQDDNERLRKEGTETLRPLVEQLRDQVEQAKHEVREKEVVHATAETAWWAEVSTLREQCNRRRETVQSLTQTLEGAPEELADNARADRARVKLLKRASNRSRAGGDKRTEDARPTARRGCGACAGEGACPPPAPGGGVEFPVIASERTRDRKFEGRTILP